MKVGALQLFDVREFVPPEIWQQFGEKSVWFIDMKLVEFLEWVYKHFGIKPVVNNWHEGGQFKYRGFRPPTCTTGAKLGQHRLARAVDFSVSGSDPEIIRDEIRRYWNDLYRLYGITTIEKDCPAWVHVDRRYTGMDELLEVPFQ